MGLFDIEDHLATPKAKGGVATQDFAEAVVAAFKAGQRDTIDKANPSLAGTPMAGSNVPTAVVNVPTIVPTSRTVGDQTGIFYRSLPRIDEIFNDPLGPADPMLPAPIDVIDPVTGRALPRKQQYEVGYNLNLTSRQTPWSVLRQLATSCDIVARCIQIRIGELVKMDLTFAVSKRAIEDIMARENCSRAKAARIGRLEFADEIQRLTDFWENPYPQSDRGLAEWITEFGNQHFRYDGVPVYPRYNLAKKVIGFEIIDSPTIKCLLDNRGDIPKPPFPAYQQILWGYPRGEMQASPVPDGEFYEGIKDLPNEYIKDQLSYFVQNRSTDTLYGFSAVEMCIPWATIYLERQKWMLDQFRLGTTPKTFIKTPIDSDIDPFKLAQWERMFNDQLRGQNRERNNAKLLPGGFDPVRMAQEAELYKTDMDEFLIKRLAAPFGVTPTALNVTPKSGLGGRNMSDGEASTAEAVSQAPDLDFFEDVINTLNRRYLEGTVNVTCVISDQESTKDELEAAQAGQTSTQSAQMTLNELRDEQGRTPYEQPEGDVPFVVIPGVGLQFLNGMIAAAEAQQKQQLEGGNNGPEPDPNSGGALPGSGDQDQPGGKPEGKEDPGDTEGPKGSGASQAAKARLVEDELVKFDRYTTARQKQATWRDFRFEHVSPDIAARLNKHASSEMRGAPVSDDPKGLGSSLTKAAKDVHAAMRKQVEDHYQPLIHHALATMYTGVDAAITEAMQHPDARKLKVGDVKKDADDALEANKKLAQLAISQHVIADPEELKAVLTDLYGDSFLVGTRTGEALMGDAAFITSGIAELVAGYSADFWENWTPGDPTAALQLADGGMRALLDQAGITIKGIDTTIQDRMGDAIAQAMTTGMGDAGAREAIVQLLGEAGAPQEGTAAATRAAIISVTETTRGANTASIDQYQAAGATGWNWDDYAGACDECEDEAAANPHSFDDDTPPLHPWCRCLAMPVTA